MSNHLLDLPPELRLCIYEYVFGGDDLQEVELISAFTNQPETALLRTCRAICNEAQPIHARYAALYRDKPFYLMWDPTIEASSYYIQLIEQYGQLSLPTTVQSLRLTWSNSTASVHLEINGEHEIEVLAQKGVCVGSLHTTTLFNLWPLAKVDVNQLPAIVVRNGKGAIDTCVLIGWAFDRCMAWLDRRGREDCLHAVRTSRALKWRRMYDSLVQAGRARPRKREEERWVLVPGVFHPGTRARVYRERLFRKRILGAELFG